MKETNHKASLKVSQDVIETIACVAAKEIDGVADVMTPENNIRGLMFTSNFTTTPVSIKVADGVAEITISLCLDYGAKITDVCERVQKNIKENVQTMTGIMVSKVNIAVEGIKLPANSKTSDTPEMEPVEVVATEE